MKILETIHAIMAFIVDHHPPLARGSVASWLPEGQPGLAERLKQILGSP
jgi:hypothetical protein